MTPCNLKKSPHALHSSLFSLVFRHNGVVVVKQFSHIGWLPAAAAARAADADLGVVCEFLEETPCIIVGDVDNVTGVG